MDESFSKTIIKLLKRLNGVTIEDALKTGCQPFFVDNNQVGLIRGDFLPHLKPFVNTFFQVGSEDTKQDGLKPGVHLHSDLKSYEDRTEAVNGVFQQLREKDAIPCLRGWRHENYAVAQRYEDKPLFEIERAASGILGIIGYGVHINGYTKDQDGQILMWIGRRSKTKQTFPDMYDNMCAGGLPVRMGIKECVAKECQEEASVSDSVLEKLQFTGTVSYFYEDERGLSPESQFVFDLELPHDFKPINADGEVGSFEQVTLEELKVKMAGGNFKPNCAAVCLDFLVRHGKIDPDKDPNVSYYIEQMHAPLQTYYGAKI